MIRQEERVEQRRSELRKVSEEVTKIVEKASVTTPKDRPSLFPGSGKSKPLSKLYRKRDTIHQEIASMRGKILELRSGQ